MYIILYNGKNLSCKVFMTMSYSPSSCNLLRIFSWSSKAFQNGGLNLLFLELFCPTVLELFVFCFCNFCLLCCPREISKDKCPNLEISFSLRTQSTIFLKLGLFYDHIQFRIVGQTKYHSISWYCSSHLYLILRWSYQLTATINLHYP